jgi:hypothetical protein
MTDDALERTGPAAAAFDNVVVLGPRPHVFTIDRPARWGRRPGPAPLVGENATNKMHYMQAADLQAAWREHAEAVARRHVRQLQRARMELVIHIRQAGQADPQNYVGAEPCKGVIDGVAAAAGLPQDRPPYLYVAMPRFARLDGGEPRVLIRLWPLAQDTELPAEADGRLVEPPPAPDQPNPPTQTAGGGGSRTNPAGEDQNGDGGLAVPSPRGQPVCRRCLSWGYIYTGLSPDKRRRYQRCRLCNADGHLLLSVDLDDYMGTVLACPACQAVAAGICSEHLLTARELTVRHQRRPATRRPARRAGQ